MAFRREQSGIQSQNEQIYSSCTEVEENKQKKNKSRDVGEGGVCVMMLGQYMALHSTRAFFIEPQSCLHQKNMTSATLYSPVESLEEQFPT